MQNQQGRSGNFSNFQEKAKAVAVYPYHAFKKATNTPYKRAKLSIASAGIETGLTGAAWAMGVPIPPPITTTKAVLDLGEKTYNFYKARKEYKTKVHTAALKRKHTIAAKFGPTHMLPPIHRQKRLA